MAIIRVSPELIAKWLFKGLDVEIRDARMHCCGRWAGEIELSIAGRDVPDCDHARVLFRSYRLPGDDPHTSVTIEAVE